MEQVKKLIEQIRLFIERREGTKNPVTEREVEYFQERVAMAGEDAEQASEILEYWREELQDDEFRMLCEYSINEVRKQATELINAMTAALADKINVLKEKDIDAFKNELQTAVDVFEQALSDFRSSPEICPQETKKLLNQFDDLSEKFQKVVAVTATYKDKASKERKANEDGDVLEALYEYFIVNGVPETLLQGIDWREGVDEDATEDEILTLAIEKTYYEIAHAVRNNTLTLESGLRLLVKLPGSPLYGMQNILQTSFIQITDDILEMISNNKFSIKEIAEYNYYHSNPDMISEAYDIALYMISTHTAGRLAETLKIEFNQNTKRPDYTGWIRRHDQLNAAIQSVIARNMNKSKSARDEVVKVNEMQFSKNAMLSKVSKRYSTNKSHSRSLPGQERTPKRIQLGNGSSTNDPASYYTTKSRSISRMPPSQKEDPWEISQQMQEGTKTLKQEFEDWNQKHLNISGSLDELIQEIDTNSTMKTAPFTDRLINQLKSQSEVIFANEDTENLGDSRCSRRFRTPFSRERCKSPCRKQTGVYRVYNGVYQRCEAPAESRMMSRRAPTVSNRITGDVNRTRWDKMGQSLMLTGKLSKILDQN